MSLNFCLWPSRTPTPHSGIRGTARGRECRGSWLHLDMGWGVFPGDSSEMGGPLPHISVRVSVIHWYTYLFLGKAICGHVRYGWAFAKQQHGPSLQLTLGSFRGPVTTLPAHCPDPPICLGELRERQVYFVSVRGSQAKWKCPSLLQLCSILAPGSQSR